MEIAYHEGTKDDQLVVALSGDLDLYVSVAFCQAVTARLESGAKRLALDFSAVRYLDSSGVGALIRLLQKARSLGGEVRIAGLGGSPKKVLEMSNILPLLKPADQVSSVLKAWG